MSQDLNEVKLTFPLLYRTMLLIHFNKQRIAKDPTISTEYYAANGRGNSIKNSRSYRRSGGQISTQKRPLMDWEKAWKLFRLRSDEIAKMLYKYGLKEAGSAVYAFNQATAKHGINKSVNFFFKNRNYIRILPQLVELQIKKARPNTDPKAALFGTTLDIDGVMESTISLDLGYSHDLKYPNMRDILKDINT